MAPSSLAATTSALMLRRRRTCWSRVLWDIE
jgi:hypothetical protein